jgi:hypothetical protein
MEDVVTDTSKPRTFQADLASLPDTLRPLVSLPHWVCWRWERNEKGKWTKVPYRSDDPSRKASNDDPSTWGTHADAVQRFREGIVDGIGFNLLASEYGAIDLDHCRDPNTESVAEWAQNIMNRANRAYAEVTVSGTGLRIIGTGAKEKMHRKFSADDGEGSFELYRGAERFITVSGLVMNGRNSLPNIDDLLDSLEREYEEKKRQKRKASSISSDNGTELPRHLTMMLHLDDPGPNRPLGEYEKRSAALFAFIKLALKACVDENAVANACLNEQFRGKAIYEHCQKAGGEDYVKRQIERALNDEAPAATDDQKQIIRVKRGGRHIATDATQSALIAARCPIFYRGGFIVEPVWRWEKTSKPNRDTLITSFVTLSTARLSYIVAKHAAIYQRYAEREKKWVPTNPPTDVMEQLLGLRYWDFPTVRGIVNSPTMRPDGTILDKPGYDPATQLWYQQSSDFELPPIPDRPTKEEAESALKLLEDLISGFPFKDNSSSKAVALAAMMTPVLRGAFEFVPLFLFLAPESGTGKTYLIIVISTIATGRMPMAVIGCVNSEEMDKRLAAAAFEAMPILSLNNLSFDLESDILNTMITEGVIGIRPFGRNDVLVPCDCRGTTVYANGNNIRVVGDLVRRTLTANLDAKMAQPETRTFDFDPIERVKADRGKYLAAIFTIARAYIADGCREVNAAALAGFDGWSRMVRYPLIWLGQPDPVDSMKTTRQLDPNRDDLRQRLEILSKLFGADTEFTAADVEKKATEMTITGGGLYGRPEMRFPELVGAFSRNGHHVNSRSIGRQLMRDLNRVSSDGYHVELVEKDARSGHVYKLVKAEMQGSTDETSRGSTNPQVNLEEAEEEEDIPF